MGDGRAEQLGEVGSAVIFEVVLTDPRWGCCAPALPAAAVGGLVIDPTVASVMADARRFLLMAATQRQRTWVGQFLARGGSTSC